MKNPLKDCDCKLSDETADPLMMVNSFNTVCSSTRCAVTA